MEKRTINVLGTAYVLKICTEQEDERLKGYDGATDNTTKELLVESYEGADAEGLKGNLRAQIDKNKRHEIIHAFLCESGLAENSTDQWALNEEMVDWIAMQFPKLLQAFEAADAI